MKVMISQPMQGVPDEEVKRIQRELYDLFQKLHIEVVDSFITTECPEDTNHPGVFYLGRTLEKFMCGVDAVYFVEGWHKARGCRIERKICEEYGIKILDASFFRDPRDELVKQEFTPVYRDCNMNNENHIPHID